MRFFPLVKEAEDVKVLQAEYKAGRAVGKVQLGETYFYFKDGLKTYYIAYEEIQRVFRRVMLVQTKMCCGKGNLEVENLVICGADGELAQIQLPGARAGKVLLEEIAKKAPQVQIGRPTEA